MLRFPAFRCRSAAPITLGGGKMDKNIDFVKLSEMCETIMMLCSLGDSLEYEINNKYRAKVNGMLAVEVKKLYDQFAEFA